MDIMSGEYSKDMWNKINTSKTVEDLKDALYLVCCRLQELEAKLQPPDKKLNPKQAKCSYFGTCRFLRENKYCPSDCSCYTPEG